MPYRVASLIDNLRNKDRGIRRAIADAYKVMRLRTTVITRNLLMISLMLRRWRNVIFTHEKRFEISTFVNFTYN